MATFERDISSIESAIDTLDEEKNPQTVTAVILVVRALIVIARLLAENHNDS